MLTFKDSLTQLLSFIYLLDTKTASYVAFMNCFWTQFHPSAFSQEFLHLSFLTFLALLIAAVLVC